MNKEILKYIVVLLAVGIFTLVFIINRKVKGPNYTPEEDEMCGKCTNVLCKRSKKETKNCEELNNEQK